MRIPSTPVFNFRQDTASVNITTSYSAVLGATDLATESTMVHIYNGSTTSMLLGLGATGAQVSYMQISPGMDMNVPAHLSKFSELWVKSNSGTISSGELIITFFY